MAYTLTKTNDALSIAEQQYATAQNKLMFTMFTSCIGVVAKKGDKLTGVHLVIVGEPPVPGQEGPRFGADASDVPNVIAKLNLPADAVCVFGCFDVWRHPANQVVPAFEKLTGDLSEKVGKSKFFGKGIKMYEQCRKDIGTYVAEIRDEGIIIRDKANAVLAPIL
jgi:hypothetical protein